jgi:hypothetical protein
MPNPALLSYYDNYDDGKRNTLYPQMLAALTSPTSGGRSVGIVRLRTKAAEFMTMENQTYNVTNCHTVVKRNK